MLTEGEIFRKRPKVNPVDWVRNLTEGYGLGVDIAERVDKTGRMKYVFRDVGSEDKSLENHPRRVSWSFEVRVQGRWKEMMSVNQRIENEKEPINWITMRVMLDGSEHNIGNFSYGVDGNKGECLIQSFSLPTVGKNALSSNVDSEWYNKEFDLRTRNLEVLELIGAGFVRESDLPERIDFEATYNEFVEKAVGLDFSLPRLVVTE